MTAILVPIFMVVIGLICLWKGADWLVDGASTIAKNFGVPPIVIGLTIVAFGTSLPELIVSVIAALNGNSAIAFGNVLGSNIANVFLILGVSALLRALPIQKTTLKIDIPIALAASILMLVLGYDQIVSRTDGLLLLAGFAAFFYLTIRSSKKGATKTSATASPKKTANQQIAKPILLVVIGLILLAVGGNVTVNGASQIATYFGWSQALIGLTIVAIGTSLPELITSIVGVLKRETDLVIGNIVGSNIFNTLWILGLSSVIKPMTITDNLHLDLWFNVATFVLVLFFASWGKPKRTIKWWQGLFFVIIYAVYMSLIVGRG